MPSFDLNEGWTVSPEDGADAAASGKTVTGVSLPAYALDELHKAGLVPDPLVRFGELDLRWAANTKWTFTLPSFETPACLLDEGAPGELPPPVAELVLEGVDAVASIELNGEVVARCESAFYPVVVDVTAKLLRGGNRRQNSLAVRFEGALDSAAERARRYPYKVPYVGQVGALPDWNHVRKAASDFGWDWGPAFAPVGVAGGVRLDVRSSAGLVGATVRQEHHRGGSDDGGARLRSVDVHFDAILRRAGGRAEKGKLVASPVGGAAANGVVAPVEVDVDIPASSSSGYASNDSKKHSSGDWDDTFTVTATVRFSDANGDLASKLWWPHGYGPQTLFDFELKYVPESSPGPSASASASAAASASASESSVLRRRVGLRTVELVREPAPFSPPGPTPEQGGPDASETFYFRVNGVPIFAKGANYIPPHIFHSRAPSLARLAVRNAAAAHMNMVRVWGGGAYPPDAFFDAADELGVLVWQEFMAACALYPRDANFLELCRRELRYQAARAGAHACLAIWGGNNELEPAFSWFAESRLNEKLFACDYAALFVDVVHRTIKEVHPGVAFIDSSPTNCSLSEEPYVKRWGDSGSIYAGDVHFYDYESDPLDPDMFPKARFVSEFGFQSHPSFECFANYTSREDWARDAKMVLYRQRHSGGNEEMDRQIARTFVLPPSAPPADGAVVVADASTECFRHWIYLTQCNQAMAYETAVGMWRHLRNHEQYRCSGSLYWQLNDIWAGQSWSGLDADGGWRLLHHAARRFYGPLALWCDVRGDKLKVTAASDVRWTLSGELQLDVIPWSARAKGDVPSEKSSRTISVSIAEQASPVVFEDAWDSVLGPGVAREDAVVRLRLRASGRCPEGGVAFPRDAHRCCRSLSSSSVSSSSDDNGGDLVSFAAGEEVEFTAEAVAYPARPKLARGLAVAPKLSFDAFEEVVVAADAAAESLSPPPSSSSSRRQRRRRARFTLSTPAVAPLVALSAGPENPGIFSDSGFLLLPWEPRTIEFEAFSEHDGGNGSGSGNGDADADADGGSSLPPPLDLDALRKAVERWSLSLGDTLIWGDEREAPVGKLEPLVPRPEGGAAC